MREMTLLGDMPEWLVAITQPERLKAALRRCISELASATSSLKDVPAGGCRGGIFTLLGARVTVTPQAQVVKRAGGGD